MGKKSKSKSASQPTSASSPTTPPQWRFQWWQLLVPAAIALLVALIGKMPPLSELNKREKPEFALANPITRPDSGIVIMAQNRAAWREEPLNVELDGFLFPRAAERLANSLWPSWHFDVLRRRLPDSLLVDGAHRVRVGFAGEPLSEYLMLGFSSQPPIVSMEVTQPQGEPQARIFRGNVASKLQAIAETMSVDIAFHSEGRPVEIPLPIKRVTDQATGRSYFEFETEVRGLPKISPSDPRYAEPFFAIRVTDQAGNRYYQLESYAQFMAPGDKRFGINSLNDIEVQRLPVDLRPNTKVAFRLMPKAPPRALLGDGKPALVLKVTSLAANINYLKWQSNLPEELRSSPSITLIYRDEQYFTVSFGDEYTDSQSPEGVNTRYRVQQTGRDGRDYTSNTAQAAPVKQPRRYLAVDEVERMLKEHGFFDRNLNPEGQGFLNQYENITRQGTKLVFDSATGLTWQQSGSENILNYDQAQAYVKKANSDNFGGYNDWRLPMLKEVMSLMEPEKHGELYLDRVFDHKQWWIWTFDYNRTDSPWFVHFMNGACFDLPVGNSGFVRVVRGGKPII